MKILFYFILIIYHTSWWKS